MNHDIIKDLIPSYIDGMTSEESNRLIEEHVANCPACKKYLEDMKKTLAINTVEETKKVDILKKVKKSNRKKVIYSILSTLGIITLILGGLYWYYGRMWTTSSDDITQSIQQIDSTVEITYTPKKKNQVLLYTDIPSQNQLTYIIYATRKTPFDPPLPEKLTFSIEFLDADTIYLPDGQTQHIMDDDVIEIQFADKMERINLKELYNQTY